MTIAPYETDTIPTAAGDLQITFLGHGTLILTFQGKTIHVDPFGRVADYSKMPKADIVFITHEHGDHLDLDALQHIRTDATIIVQTGKCEQANPGGVVMRNGDAMTVEGIPVEAVPAYNIQHKRENGQPFHPRGEGNGYVLTFGETRVYIGGDTENIPEMQALREIDIAFLPMNLPYTMTPEMAADAARQFKPKVLYPYHFGSTETARLGELLQGEPIEVRIRRLA